MVAKNVVLQKMRAGQTTYLIPVTFLIASQNLHKIQYMPNIIMNGHTFVEDSNLHYNLDIVVNMTANNTPACQGQDKLVQYFRKHGTHDHFVL